MTKGEGMKKPLGLLFTLFCILAMVSIACGSSDNIGTKVGEVNSSSTEDTSTKANSEQNTPNKDIKLQEKYAVGDIISLPKQIIVLNGAQYSGNILVADFLIGNTSDEFQTVSSMMSFSARNSDGTNLDQAIFDCGSSLDGAIAPGDKLKGEICWENAAPGAKIYYEENFLSSGAVVWEITDSVPPSDIQIPEIETLTIKSNLSTVGEEIALNGQKIILNSAELNNGILNANFTINNTGTEDLNISSLMSFDARAKDGKKLEQDIFNCSSSLDGTVLPNDMLRGNICWSGATSGTKIYYSAGLLSSQYVVWEIN